ncbi:MAG: glycosyltransferase [Bacteroidales bacterium]|nr:glycosyltransferase [Bacteroidales bacterium]
MKQLSVIIPMYNVEPYVDRCICSLEDQDIPRDEYEIICINDGSPDDSRGVIKRMQKEFDNIILIDQENQGVSRARNNGIEKATGRYLMFIDPDDYVDSKSFGKVLKNASEKNAQVSILGFTFLYQDGSVRKCIFNEKYISDVHVGIRTYFLIRADGLTDPDRMVAVLFETEFMNRNKLRYLPNVPYLEDGEFIARILCLAERCIFDGSSFYQRTTRPGSATNSELYRSEKSIRGFLLAAVNLRRFQQEPNLKEEQRIFLNHPICKFVLLTLNSALQKPYMKNYKKIRELLFNNSYRRIELKGVEKPYNYYVHIYNSFMPAFLISALVKEIKQIVKRFFGR